MFLEKNVYIFFQEIFYTFPSMGTYLGQNFLIDAKVRRYIADKILSLYREWECETLIEIGPGKGSITKLIQNISDNFFVIDKDSTFYDNGQLNIEHGEFILGDILEVDVEKLLSEKKLHSEKTLIVGNLPYYITSPILRKFFSAGQNYAGGIFMVQDEVGQKITTDAKKKSYLRRLLNFFYDVTYLKGVSAKSFKPAPKVKSCLIELRIKDEALSIERNTFVEFLELFAPFSRKTLGAISKIIDKRNRDICHLSDCLPSFDIPESLQQRRLEELSWDDIGEILF